MQGVNLCYCPNSVHLIHLSAVSSETHSHRHARIGPRPAGMPRALGGDMAFFALLLSFTFWAAPSFAEDGMLFKDFVSNHGSFHLSAPIDVDGRKLKAQACADEPGSLYYYAPGEAPYLAWLTNWQGRDHLENGSHPNLVPEREIYFQGGGPVPGKKLRPRGPFCVLRISEPSEFYRKSGSHSYASEGYQVQPTDFAVNASSGERYDDDSKTEHVDFVPDGDKPLTCFGTKKKVCAEYSGMSCQKRSSSPFLMSEIQAITGPSLVFPALKR